jgi:retron-type reverse transcriptase
MASNIQDTIVNGKTSLEDSVQSLTTPNNTATPTNFKTPQGTISTPTISNIDKKKMLPWALQVLEFKDYMNYLTVTVAKNKSKGMNSEEPEIDICEVS